MMKIPYDQGDADGGAEGSGARQQARVLLPAADRVLRLGEDGRVARRARRCTSRSPPGPGAPTSARRAWRRASASRPRRYARHHVNVSMCRAKYSGTYANSILANLEATEHGYDEGLLLDVDGFVAEGAGENLFIVKNGKIYEPELTSALIGITRDTVITLAADLGYEVTRAAHHARRPLHRRRGLLHRHRRRGHADPRGRRPHHRRRPARPGHRRSSRRRSSTW